MFGCVVAVVVVIVVVVGGVVGVGVEVFASSSSYVTENHLPKYNLIWTNMLLRAALLESRIDVGFYIYFILSYISTCPLE